MKTIITSETNSIQWPESARITAVEPADFPLVLDVLETAFPDVSRSFFHTITMRDPNYKSHFSLAMQEGRRFLSYAQIFDRVMIVNGQSIRFGGIGSVGTRPEFRGKGYAQALLVHAIQVMESAGMQGSLLFTHINPFYEKLGWKTLCLKEQDIDVARLRNLRPPPHFYRSSKNGDIDSLETIYANRQDTLSGTLKRNRDYWLARTAWMNHSPTSVFRNDNMMGYFYAAQYDNTQPVLNITEYGYTQPGDKVFDLFLGVMARKAESMRCQTIRGFFRNDPALEEYLLGRDLIASEHDHTYMMWRDFGQSNVLGELESLTARRRFTYWSTDGF